MRQLFDELGQSCSTTPPSHQRTLLRQRSLEPIPRAHIQGTRSTQEKMNGHKENAPLISGIAHINLVIPPGTLEQANTFYGETLGLTPRAVPAAQKGSLAWFDIATSGQQVHIAFGDNGPKSSRHPCFKVSSPEALLALRQKVWEHHQQGGDAAPQEADRPGAENSGESHLDDVIPKNSAMTKCAHRREGRRVPSKILRERLRG